MTAKLMVAALAAAGALQLCAADLDDGLKFKLDFRTTQTGIPAARTVGNALNVSGEVSNDGTDSGGNKDSRRTRQEAVEIADWRCPSGTCTAQALYFPQYVTDADGTKRADPVGFNFPNAALKETTLTAYVRFKWSGAPYPETSRIIPILSNAFDADWTGQSGWSIGIKHASSQDPSKEYGYLACIIPSVGWNITEWGSTYAVEAYRVYPDVWYDLFVTMTPSESDASKTVVHFYLSKESSNAKWPKWTQNIGATISSKLTFADSLKNVRISSLRNGRGWEPLPDAVRDNESYALGFRGWVTRACIWNRVLSETEMWRVIADRDGTTWKLGVANGSADEFAATTAADSVWTASSTWSTVCRELTEEHPSLTVVDTFPADEAGLTKILSVKPLLTGAAAARIAVSVNDAKVGEYDLAGTSGRAIEIPGKFWKSDADGKVSVRIERLAPFVGKLELDALALCGGWQMTGTGSQGQSSPQFYVGERNTGTLWGATERQDSAGIYNYYVNIDAYVPAEAIGNHRYCFEVKFKGSSKEGIAQALSVNGHEIAACESKSGVVFKAEVPPEYLTPGFNRFTVQNNTTSYNWISYNYYRISTKERHGAMIIVR